MKILSKNIVLCIAILSFLIMGCKDDITNSNFSNNDPVTFTVYGKVINEEGNILSDARVSLNGQEIYTNQLGMYLFKDIEIDGNGSFLKVNKNGYFNSGRRIQAKDASVKKIDIQLLEENEASSFSSSVGGEIILNDDGLKVEFQANGFVNENGNPYNGNVAVKYTFIPVDENLANKAPGGLSAINTEGEEVVLASFGMLGIELNNGNVNIAEGYTAKITMPIANEFLADAPSTIPLWHLNEETGFWEEEGTATLQGNTYVGDVSHFSFWNCDYPFPFVELSFQVVDDNNNPLVYKYISGTISNTGEIGGGWTDDNGYIVDKFPKDEIIQLTMSVDNDCSSAVYVLNENIGPFQENTDLGVFTATLQEEASMVQIQGTIDNTCTNNNEDGYYLFVESNNNSNCRWEFYIDDNNFDVQFLGSNINSYTAIMYDVVNFAGSDEYTIEAGLNNIGMVSVCNTPDEYVILHVEGNEPLNMTVDSYYELVYHSIDSSLVRVTPRRLFGLNGVEKGYTSFVINYTDVNDRLNTSSLSYLRFWVYPYSDSCDDEFNYPCDQTLTLNEFGYSSGEYISGTISGEILETIPNGELFHNYTMDFRIKID